MVLDSVSYDQFEDFPVIIDAKAIFSDECYIKLYKLIQYTQVKGREIGVFFLGRRSSSNPNVILIEKFTSNFANDDGLIEGGATYPVSDNLIELSNIISYYESLGEKPVLIHFHVHPNKLRHESYSDQDLTIYADLKLQKPEVGVYGMLAFPPHLDLEVDKPTTYGLSIVEVRNPVLNGSIHTGDFYLCPSIYYSAASEILKVGEFDKQYHGRRNKANYELNIVRNMTHSTTPRKVSGIGNQVINNHLDSSFIEDVIVGKKEESGYYIENEFFSFNNIDDNKRGGY